MSVLIKDMDMPKFCGVNECPLCTLGWREKNRYTEWCHRPNGGGFVMVGYHNEENKIPDDCPLSDAGEEFMKHYRQGREDEKADANGTLMQAFNPD